MQRLNRLDPNHSTVETLLSLQHKIASLRTTTKLSSRGWLPLWNALATIFQGRVCSVSVVSKKKKELPPTMGTELSRCRNTTLSIWGFSALLHAVREWKNENCSKRNPFTRGNTFSLCCEFSTSNGGSFWKELRGHSEFYVLNLLILKINFNRHYLFIFIFMNLKLKHKFWAFSTFKVYFDPHFSQKKSSCNFGWKLILPSRHAP